MRKITLPRFRCLRCGHKWNPYRNEVPRCCAWCKTSYWNVEPGRPSKTWERHAIGCEACRSIR